MNIHFYTVVTSISIKVMNDTKKKLKRGLKGIRILDKNPSREPSFWTQDWPWTDSPGFKNLRRNDYKSAGVFEMG